MMERADAQGIKTYVGRCCMCVNCKDIRDIQGRSYVKYEEEKKRRKNCNLTGMS